MEGEDILTIIDEIVNGNQENNLQRQHRSNPFIQIFITGINNPDALERSFQEQEVINKPLCNELVETTNNRINNEYPKSKHNLKSIYKVIHELHN
jgi:hypothetical protein